MYMTNIVKKTPSGNYMILNYAKIDYHNGIVKVPVVDDLAIATHMTCRDAQCHRRYCTITKQYYEKL